MNIAIIGGGPAGLRAAEVAAEGGATVTLFDAKPSVGRKFLVAGRGGLNLTNAEPRESFVKHYTGDGQADDLWRSLIDGFNAGALQKWATGLGVETFAASTGRVYPKELKAAPLLRRWVQRLRELGVKFEMRHRWTGLSPGTPLQLHFGTDGESCTITTDAAILALGGGSWPETGSDGAWTTVLEQLGIDIARLSPANCGWELPWPPALLAIAEGKPLKNIAIRVGENEVAGELMVTRYGLEGGAIYQFGAALRAMESPVLTIDFKPDTTFEKLTNKMSGVKRNFLVEGRQRWKLSDVAIAILETRGPFDSVESLAREVKSCTLQLTGPRPIAEAISSAGGVKWNELDRGLMLQKLPGVFVAGEMIDWEAPTGGYLIQGCFATGTRAAQSALKWISRRD